MQKAQPLLSGMRIAAYQSLYESSLAFAVRKAVTGEEQKSELLQKTKSLTHECDELRQALIDQTVRLRWERHIPSSVRRSELTRSMRKKTRSGSSFIKELSLETSLNMTLPGT
eukprot:747219-Hanusia_phi.AAC.13